MIDRRDPEHREVVEARLNEAHRQFRSGEISESLYKASLHAIGMRGRVIEQHTSANWPVKITKPGSGNRATACLMPEKAPPKEAQIYRGMRDVIIKAHCADKRPSHKCCGRITIEAKTITFQCPRCGDSRLIIDDIPADKQAHPAGCPDAQWCRNNRLCYWGCKNDGDE